MPLPIINSVLRAQQRGHCPSGAPWTNTWHFHLTGGGPWTSGLITSQDAMLQKLWSTNVYAGGVTIKASVTPSTIWDDTVYTILDGTSASIIIINGTIGTGGGNSQPSEVSAVATLRTAKRGRSYRGRVYLPPQIAGAVGATGFLTGAQQAALVAQFTGWVADMLANGPGTLHVASYLHATSELVTAVTIDNKYDVQRRRKI